MGAWALLGTPDQLSINKSYPPWDEGNPYNPTTTKQLDCLQLGVLVTTHRRAAAAAAVNTEIEWELSHDKKMSNNSRR